MPFQCLLSLPEALCPFPRHCPTIPRKNQKLKEAEISLAARKAQNGSSPSRECFRPSFLRFCRDCADSTAARGAGRKCISDAVERRAHAADPPPLPPGLPPPPAARRCPAAWPLVLRPRGSAGPSDFTNHQPSSSPEAPSYPRRCPAAWFGDLPAPLAATPPSPTGVSPLSTPTHRFFPEASSSPVAVTQPGPGTPSVSPPLPQRLVPRTSRRRPLHLSPGKSPCLAGPGRAARDPGIWVSLICFEMILGLKSWVQEYLGQNKKFLQVLTAWNHPV